MSGEKESFQNNAVLASQDQKTNSHGIGADMEKQSPDVVDGDEALKIIGNGDAVEVDAAVNRRLLRKIGGRRAV